MLHYVALRRNELRPLQDQLARLGLSSLGRAEAHVMANLDSLLQVLGRLAGRGGDAGRPFSVGFDRGTELLSARAARLLGPRSEASRVRIMVTMPSAAAHDPEFVLSLAEGRYEPDAHQLRS